MYIKRQLQQTALELADQYPIITITGPRQSGKTTMVREIFDKPYVNLEDIQNRNFATEDPRGFLAEYSDGAIIDEIQRAPELPSYLQVHVDEKKKNNLFVITGSEQFRIRNSISQSLAGRTAILRLLPLSVQELIVHDPLLANKQLLYAGSYPRLYQQQIQPKQFYRDYLETYLEKDVRQISNIRNLSVFQKFLSLCAGRVGQLLDLTGLSNDIGVSHTTISDWISILEASYTVFRLPPYYANLSKRLIKSPKIYFYDNGLLCYLLSINNHEHYKTHPLRGQIFENFVVSEALKTQYNNNEKENLFFYRDQKGHEVDLLFARDNKYDAVEIKSADTISKSFFKNLTYLKNLLPDVILEKVLIYGGKDEQRSDIKIVNYLNFR